MMIRAAMALAKPGGAAAHLQVFIFHRVHARPDPLFPSEPDATRFDRLCTWLRHWFHVLPLDEAAERLQEGRLPARAAAITFDDGYRDNHDVALPILQRHGLTATFFVATGFLNGGRMWNDDAIEALRGTKLSRLDLAGTAAESLGALDLGDWPARRRALSQVLKAAKYLPATERAAFVAAVLGASHVRASDRLMMDDAQVVALHLAGMQIGGHTVHHPILRRIGDTEAREEICSGKAALEALIQAPVTLFAYPNGVPDVDYDARHVAMVREAGFTAAVSTSMGCGDRHSDPLQLPRFTPWDASRTRYALRLLQAARWRGQRAS